MIDPDDVATWRFHRMSPAAVVTSGLMHAAVAMALLPGFLPVHARLTERAIEVTLDLPATPPTELSASSAAIVQQAAHNTDPGSGALEQSAPERGEQHTLAAPPQPSEPDLASVLPSSEPPPPVEAREFATSSPAAAPVTEAERILPPLEAPPPLTGRDFAMTAPSSVPQTQAAQRQAQTPAPAHPVQRAKPTRASRQQPLPEGSLRANRQPDRPPTTAPARRSRTICGRSSASCRSTASIRSRARTASKASSSPASPWGATGGSSACRWRARAASPVSTAR